MSNTLVRIGEEFVPILFVVYDDFIQSMEIKSKIIIGRETESNKVDLNLDIPFVSRRQAEISKDYKGYYYMDTDSKNGTYYNGKRMKSDCKQYLKDGDVLHIYVEGYNKERQFVAMIFATDYLTDWECQEIPLTRNIAEINIGRTGQKSILMDDMSVSENHASFFIAKLGWAIIDHKSINGVCLNNQLIDGVKYLEIGDVVRISNAYFIYLGDKILYQKHLVSSSTKDSKHALNSDELVVRIAERSVWQRTKKLMLLQNINLSINSGEMVLILGGSGSGKTTFMNAVMGYEKAEGKIMYRNTDIYEDFESMKYKIGFVPQQDLLRTGDTVYDTLENVAQMRLPASMNSDKRKERIAFVLNTLGLAQESRLLVSRLSEGQKKRLSIAVEYITDPSLFFLDEPDASLDGVMSKYLMGKLRNIADEGKIVMVIAHNPDRVAELFNKVIVLAKSSYNNCGHLAFFGTIDKAYDFFGTNSLEDIIRRINREDEGGEGLSDYYIQKYNEIRYPK